VTRDQRDAERQAILDEIELRFGADWRKELGVRQTRWVAMPSTGRQILDAAGDMQLAFGFMPGGRFACHQRTGPDTARLIVGDADHVHFKDRTLSEVERVSWDVALADFRRDTSRRGA
jgi:hypothetical protein